MLLDQAQRVIEKSPMIESSFGIRTEDQAHIISMVRDKMYSDKIGAVVREYYANAVDANVEAGKGDIPVEIKLPTSLDPSWSIRDYGPGLSDNEMREVYVWYAASSKRNTNSAIGQLGLGSKSAFCYTDSFTVTSYLDGTESTYVLYIGESQIGDIALVNQRKTDEPNGVKVSVIVKAGDYDEFRDKTIAIAYYSKTMPNIIGVNATEIGSVYTNDKINFDIGHGRIVILVRTRSYGTTRPVLVMGGIPYPIELHLVSSDKDVLGVLENVSELIVNIGDVSVATSREALEYSDKTKTFLINAASDIRGAIDRYIEKEVYESQSLLDAKIKYNAIYQIGMVGAGRLILLNGRNVCGDLIYSGVDCVIKEANKQSWRRCRLKVRDRNSIPVSDFDSSKPFALVVDCKCNKRIVQDIMSANNISKLYLIYVNDAKKLDIKYDFSNIFTKKLSSYIVSRSARPHLSCNKKSNSKHNKKVFVLSIDKLDENVVARSDRFEDSTMDISDESNLYIEIDKFFFLNPATRRYIMPAAAKELIFLARTIGLLQVNGGDKKIYAIKTAQLRTYSDKLKAKNLYTEVENFLLSDNANLVKHAAKAGFILSECYDQIRMNSLDMCKPLCVEGSVLHRIDELFRDILFGAIDYFNIRGIDISVGIIRRFALQTVVESASSVSARQTLICNRLISVIHRYCKMHYPIMNYVTPYSGIGMLAGNQIGNISTCDSYINDQISNLCNSINMMEFYYQNKKGVI